MASVNTSALGTAAQQVDLLHSLSLQVDQASTLDEIWTAVDSVFAHLPDSCSCLWLLDRPKGVACRVLTASENGIHSEIPVVLDPDRDVTRHLQSDSKAQPVWIEPLTEMGCPRPDGARCLGVKVQGPCPMMLTVCLSGSETFDESRQHFVAALAKAAANAVDRIACRAERNLLTRVLSLGNETAQRHVFAEGIVLEVQKVTDALGCSLFLLNESTNTMVLEYSTGLFDPSNDEDELMANPVEYTYGKGCTGWIWKHRRTVCLSDALDKEEWLRIDPTGELRVMTTSAEQCEPSRPRPFIGLPIMLGAGEQQRVLGVLRLTKKRSGTLFLPYDERLLERLCSAIAPAIHRWNLEARLAHETALHKALQALIEAVHGYADGNKSEEDLLAGIATEARSLFKGDLCTILLKEPGVDALRLSTEIGPNGRQSTQGYLRLTYEQGLSGFAARTRSAQVASYAKSDPNYFELLVQVESEICVPILAGKRVLGVLYIDSYTPGFFREDDLRTRAILETFATQAATVLQRAKDIGMRDLNRQAMLNDRQRIAAAAVASGVAHEIRNGLTVITEIASQMQSRMEGCDLAGKIRAEALRLDELADTLSDLSDEKEPHLLRTALNPVVTRRVELLAEVVRARNQWIHLTLDRRLSEDSGQFFLLDEGQIAQVLTNLVLNAMESSRPGQTIEVFTTDKDCQTGSISVQDCGLGMTADQCKQVLARSVSTKGVNRGIGLWMVRKLVEEHHHGRLEISSAQGIGTTVTIHLPKATAARK